MPKRISNPSAGDRLHGIFNIMEGGHGKTTAREGLIALGGFERDKIGQPLNTIPLDEDGNIHIDYFGGLRIVETGLDGETSVNAGSLSVFHLTTFDHFTKYELSCSAGEIWQEGKSVYYRAPMEGTSADLFVDFRKYTVNISGARFTQPKILSPENGSFTTTTTVRFETATPVLEDNAGNEVLRFTDWEISKVSDFTTIFRSAYMTTDHTVWNQLGLPMDVDLYVRVRHRGVKILSAWSEPVMFKLGLEKMILRPAITTPANGSFGTQLSFTMETTSYQTQGYTGTHRATDWLIANSENFATPIVNIVADEINKTSLQVAGLQPMMLYWAKVRYHDERGTSEWSQPISFITTFE